MRNRCFLHTPASWMYWWWPRVHIQHQICMFFFITCNHPVYCALYSTSLLSSSSKICIKRISLVLYTNTNGWIVDDFHLSRELLRLIKIDVYFFFFANSHPKSGIFMVNRECGYGSGSASN